MDARIFRLSELQTSPIEREELGDGKVAYRNIVLLSAGVWTDDGSGESIWYSPRGIRNLEATENAVVNIMHDVDNEASAAGTIEQGSLREESGDLYGDIILDTNSAAGEYADENLRVTLESGGEKGFGGPSVEIPAEGQTVEMNEDKGIPELRDGKLSGLGLVKHPASKPTAFGRQTATRGVALSDGTNAKGLYLQENRMDDDNRARIMATILRRELGSNVEQEAQAIADELGVDPEKVMEMLSPLMETAEGEEMEDGDGEDEGEGESEEEEEEEEVDDGGEEEEEEEEEEGGEMSAEEMETIQNQIDELWSAMEEMKSAMMSESELAEHVEEQTAELADASAVSALKDEKESLEKRLAELEDEPEDPRTLSDGESEWTPEYDPDVGSRSTW